MAMEKSLSVLGWQVLVMQLFGVTRAPLMLHHAPLSEHNKLVHQFRQMESFLCSVVGEICGEWMFVGITQEKVTQYTINF